MTDSWTQEGDGCSFAVEHACFLRRWCIVVFSRMFDMTGEPEPRRWLRGCDSGDGSGAGGGNRCALVQHFWLFLNFTGCFVADHLGVCVVCDQDAHVLRSSTPASIHA